MDTGYIETRARPERRVPAARRDTIEILIEQLLVLQKVGQWLALETHGDAYVKVRAVNELFHQAHRQLRDMQNGETGVGALRVRRMDSGSAARALQLEMRQSGTERN